MTPENACTREVQRMNIGIMNTAEGEADALPNGESKLTYIYTYNTCPYRSQI
jgi:hypothetical protein